MGILGFHNANKAPQSPSGLSFSSSCALVAPNEEIAEELHARDLQQVAGYPWTPQAVSELHQADRKSEETDSRLAKWGDALADQDS